MGKDHCLGTVWMMRRETVQTYPPSCYPYPDYVHWIYLSRDDSGRIYQRAYVLLTHLATHTCLLRPGRWNMPALHTFVVAMQALRKLMDCVSICYITLFYVAGFHSVTVASYKRWNRFLSLRRNCTFLRQLSQSQCFRSPTPNRS